LSLWHQFQKFWNLYSNFFSNNIVHIDQTTVLCIFRNFIIMNLNFYNFWSEIDENVDCTAEKSLYLSFIKKICTPRQVDNLFFIIWRLHRYVINQNYTVKSYLYKLSYQFDSKTVTWWFFLRDLQVKISLACKKFIL
jgi:hypothetical protein